MAREARNRIDTNAASAPREGLNAAFANLVARDLPTGPAATSQPGSDTPQRIWKMGRVLLRRSTAQRAGKTVIVIHDFATHLPLSVIGKIAKKLRAGCGCGGTVRERTIEIQGDQPGKIRTLLEAEGFEVAGVK